MYLNVSIHDVTPVFALEIKCLLDFIRRLGVYRGTILVVPDFHGSAPLEPGTPFAAWLRSLAGEGWEMVLHGLTHQEPARREQTGRGGPLQYLVSRWYTSGEGEFYRLSGKAARERIERGLAILKGCGIAPAGFIAPAWLLSRESRAVLKDFRDFAFTTTLTGIHHLQSGSFYAVPAVTFSSRSSGRVFLSRLVVPLLAGLAGRRDMVRLVLHPADARQPSILRMAGHLCRSLLLSRRQVTIGEYLQLSGAGGRGLVFPGTKGLFTVCR
ncbi:MAG: polysaccharide deacetylase family protein [Thermoanaerobacteraceae bacterium]|nr:polysaccharide deacetylase family protein [Thermoanaerobacteraceae bacterium]